MPRHRLVAIRCLAQSLLLVVVAVEEQQQAAATYKTERLAVLEVERQAIQHLLVLEEMVALVTRLAFLRPKVTMAVGHIQTILLPLLAVVVAALERQEKTELVPPLHRLTKAVMVALDLRRLFPAYLLLMLAVAAVVMMEAQLLVWAAQAVVVTAALALEVMEPLILVVAVEAEEAALMAVQVVPVSLSLN